MITFCNSETTLNDSEAEIKPLGTQFPEEDYEGSNVGLLRRRYEPDRLVTYEIIQSDDEADYREEIFDIQKEGETNQEFYARAGVTNQKFLR